MIIREITVSELPDFIRSQEFALLNPKPITALRAISQCKNPHARPHNVALVFASEANILLAFAGILPHEVPEQNEPVFSNSGWWVHPVLGRKMGLPVFLKAFQHCSGRMFFTDCTAYTQSILDKTNLFTFVPAITGSRFFLRFYTGNLLQRKGQKEPIPTLFSFVDKTLNALLSFRILIISGKNQKMEFSLNTLKMLDSKHASFIEKNPGNSFLKQDYKKLNWMIQNPWVTCEKNNSPVMYPFTTQVDSFRQEFLEIKKGTRLVAFLFLSVRDNHASIPFLYFEKEFLNDVTQILWHYLIHIRSNSLLVYHPEFEEALRKNKRIWLLRKNIARFAGYSKELSFLFKEKEYFFQDGEGDVVFT